jgi:hypothetical protein
MGGFYVHVGQPEMSYFFTVKDTSIWVIYALNRK